MTADWYMPDEAAFAMGLGLLVMMYGGWLLYGVLRWLKIIPAASADFVGSWCLVVFVSIPAVVHVVAFYVFGANLMPPV